ncbi:MAG TPA: 30S ribosomal protein S1 [Candidatus Limnocylindrales bacterium]
MTDEQQGGTTPATDAPAAVDTQASDRPAGAIAVADEPAETTAAATEAPTEESADGAASSGDDPVATSEDTATQTAATPDDPTAAAVSGAAASSESTALTDSGASEPAVSEAATSDGATAPAEPSSATAEPADEARTPIATAEATPEASDTPTAEGATAEGATAEAAPAEAAPAEAAPAEAAPAEAAPEPPAPKRDLGPEPTTMEELLAEQESDIKSFKHGDVVEGTVVRIDKDEILVDIGAKSEGVVSNRELFGRHGGGENQAPLNIGDTVLVYVLQPESPEGHAVLSLRRAGLERKWRAMQEQFEAGVIIEAPVIDHNKGGLIVDCGIRGFVPISQIVDFPRRPQNDQPRDAAQEIAEKLQPFVGRKLRLKILEVNRKANRLILSEKVALYEERREKRDELFSSLEVGQKVTGTVRSIAPFGVFIDLGGIDGLVHKSELSWNKVNNPEAGYKVGDEVEAEVIDINHERGRISLSIRRLQPDPWHSTVADFKVGDIIDGTVTKLVNFGAFVRVRDGLEGLIHISELSHQRVAHPGDVEHEGQSLKLKIISLDSERHRLGLSLKQAEEPPARPAAEPGQGPSGRSERRPRQERGYSMSDAIQEPEGGIDDTLASAFAQVRQQLAEAETADVETAATAGPEETATADPEPATAEAETAEVETAATAAPEETATAEPEPATAEAETADVETAATAAPEETATAEPEPATAEAETADVETASVTAEEAPTETEPVAETATSTDADDPTATAEPVAASEQAAAVEEAPDTAAAEAEATAEAPSTEDETKA